MKNFVEHLSTYAEYHRDSRNIMTHLLGIPIIVFSVILLLSRPVVEINDLTLTPATIVMVISAVFYIKLNVVFGLIMSVLLVAGIFAANTIAASTTAIWLGSGLSLFVLGWVIQFIGHYYEGKKPAFVDDVMGLMIGPLFVLAEVMFALGLFSNLKSDIESRVGPVRNAMNTEKS